jgi:hypothetical protein
MGEEILFKSPRNFLENPKRLFKNFGDFEKNFPKKKVPVKSDHVDGLPPSQNLKGSHIKLRRNLKDVHIKKRKLGIKD